MSLEEIIEREDLGLEVLHPGGMKITEELARLCHIKEGSRVLDVACGTGETACHLAEKLRCRVTGIDHSPLMIELAQRKARERGVEDLVTFQLADAHRLPFPPESFDAVISECTLCLLDKKVALREMCRVVRRGGWVGIHDIAWKEGVPERVKVRLKEIEGEVPETFSGWRKLFEEMGLTEIIILDRSDLIPRWMKEMRKEIGLRGELRIFLRILKEEGLKGLRDSVSSMRIFQSRYTGYVLMAGRKPKES